MDILGQLSVELRTQALLISGLELLAWDQEVCMPPAGAASRAALHGTLAGMVHQRIIEKILPLLREANTLSDIDDATRRDIRLLLEDAEIAEKIPSDLVRAFSEAASYAQRAWVDAKSRSDFESFRPHLEKLVKLSREKAAAIGYQNEPYEALLHLFERSVTPTDIEQLFSELRPFLMETIRLCQENPIGGVEYPPLYMSAAEQKALIQTVVKQLGYDLTRGRIDESVHPFCTGISPDDVRITIRINEKDLTAALSAALHEMGHALYEQGLPREPLGWPITHASSLSVHESQSRFWENHVGASVEFWTYLYENVLPHYTLSWLSAHTPFSLARQVNKIQPGLIRIESDEVSYHLHILLRFELERALINGDLTVRELPVAWNDKVAEYLNLAVPDDAHGVLQDVHWSMGSFGYFPTYSLGSLLAAQLSEALTLSHPEWPARLSEGDASLPLHWMRTNIHAHGARYRIQELCERATGAPLSAKPFIRYIRRKVAQLYEGLALPA
ncbi:MAG: carboxypeptidase M32 [Bacteroidia bacterium]|nr:carboxypeptidase M32 [Bacteroidia bacterium]MCX7651929.1 carboxypeptidase M32 [Bacteroidia bacterium]MDW8416080.1 carboxypeptidase M32 [Bacteroidia bacterium]